LGDVTRSEPANDTAAAPEASEAGPRTYAQDNADKATGGDYTRAGLADQVRQLVTRPRTQEGPGRQSEQAAPDAVGTELDRLRDPAALAACVRALGSGPPPLAIDYGRYEGRPALVVVLPGATPATLTAVVAGPACGLTGTDELHRVTVARP
ncbi:MAG TPA: hypothetical protein VGR21_08555, partial [Cryptosporangiaceae bacterium]|nr:hypothetical protein [Cryptosporangiaceae bacterium]